MKKTKSNKRLVFLTIGLLFILHFLTSCSSTIDIYQQDYKDNIIHGKTICKTKNMEYTNIYTPNVIDWFVVCYTKSPLKFYEYKIK